MDTKICSSCGASVPEMASRCKHCMHDLLGADEKRFPLTLFLGVLALLSSLGGGAFWYRASQSAENIFVDLSTESIVITEKSSLGLSTDRIHFADIAKVELVLGGPNATYEVSVVMHDNSRHIMSLSNDNSLRQYADNLSRQLDKPMVEDQRTKAFGSPPSDN